MIASLEITRSGVDLNLDTLRDVLLWSMVVNYGVLLLNLAPLVALWVVS